MIAVEHKGMIFLIFFFDMGICFLCGICGGGILTFLEIVGLFLSRGIVG